MEEKRKAGPEPAAAAKKVGPETVAAALALYLRGEGIEEPAAEARRVLVHFASEIRSNAAFAEPTIRALMALEPPGEPEGADEPAPRTQLPPA